MKVADIVVIRHVCHCDTAIERPKDDESQEHVFRVDGEDFPWYISKEGIIVTQLTDDLFAVRVEIFAIGMCLDEYGKHPDLSLRLDGELGRRLFIGDVEFPWEITGDGVVIKASAKTVPSVTLSFFVRDVDSNQYIDDERYIVSIDGDHYVEGVAVDYG